MKDDGGAPRDTHRFDSIPVRYGIVERKPAGVGSVLPVAPAALIWSGFWVESGARFLDLLGLSLLLLDLQDDGPLTNRAPQLFHLPFHLKGAAGWHQRFFEARGHLLGSPDHQRPLRQIRGRNAHLLRQLRHGLVGDLPDEVPLKIRYRSPAPCRFLQEIHGSHLFPSRSSRKWLRARPRE